MNVFFFYNFIYATLLGYKVRFFSRKILIHFTNRIDKKNIANKVPGFVVSKDPEVRQSNMEDW